MNTTNKKITKKVDDSNDIELIKLAQNNDVNARNSLIKKYSSLTKFIIKKYFNQFSNYEELLQEGNLALNQAIDNYEISKQTKFSTYAIFYIKKYIYEYLNDQNNLEGYSTYTIRLASKIRKIENTHQLSNGNNITDLEIYELLNKKYSIQKIIEARIYLSKKDLSYYVQNESFGILDEYDLENLNLEEKIKDLSEREQDIIKMRFGYNYLRPYSLSEIGKKYNLSRERIRQILKKALFKLKNSVVKEERL